jgi:hypothetical protein
MNRRPDDDSKTLHLHGRATCTDGQRRAYNIPWAWAVSRVPNYEPEAI